MVTVTTAEVSEGNNVVAYKALYNWILFSSLLKVYWPSFYPILALFFPHGQTLTFDRFLG